MKLFSVSILLTFCVLAANIPEHSSNSSKKISSKPDYSSITSQEGLQQQAEIVTKSFIGWFNDIPTKFFRCEDEFSCAVKAEAQLVKASKLAKSVQSFLPLSGSETSRALVKICNSIDPIIIELKDEIERDKTKGEGIHKSETGSFTKYIPYRAEALREIVKTLQSIRLDKFSFSSLIMLTDFLSKLSRYLQVEYFNIVKSFLRKMKYLREREAELQVQNSDVDHGNIGDSYAVMKEGLLELLANMDVKPKGPPSSHYSTALHFLAVAVQMHSEISSGSRDNTRATIKDIFAGEKQKLLLYKAWKKKNNEERSENSSEESGCSEDE